MRRGTCPSRRSAFPSRRPSSTIADVKRLSRQQSSNTARYVVAPPSESPAAPVWRRSIAPYRVLSGSRFSWRTCVSTNDTSAGWLPTSPAFAGARGGGGERGGEHRRRHDRPPKTHAGTVSPAPVSGAVAAVVLLFGFGPGKGDRGRLRRALAGAGESL